MKIIIFLVFVPFCLNAQSGLNDSLKVYYKMEEASGTRTDEIGSNDLTANGVIGNATGIILNAVNFDNTTHLSLADVDAVSTGDIDWTIAFWVYPTDDAGLDPITAKRNGGTIEWQIHKNTNETITFHGGGTGFWTVASTETVTLSAWNLVIVWHDATNSLAYIQINNTTAVSAAAGTPGYQTTPDMFVGKDNVTGPGFLTGRVDEYGLWKRVLTESERTSLYNGGAGKTYPYTDPVSGDFSLKNLKRNKRLRRLSN